MKTRALTTLIPVALLVLAGCEGAKYPLSDPGYSTIDSQLIGSWGIVDSDNEDGSFINVFAFDEHAYYVESWEEGEEDELVRLNVFSTVVDGVTFANIRCINCDDDEGAGEYFFFAYELTGDDELVVKAISDDLYDDLEDLESVDAVRKLVRDRMHDDDFYDDGYGRYHRLDEDPLAELREG